ncbi:MAG: 16S rRNA (adenine(1518)-N(6)/adenine(1519)-N(6))-dimethyltransferase RsmA [Oscillospiraceae bacterium]|nr:16S rRNA (adenine(1518)-N(6)/adenine(1519)-N(6))-dimethyltransferase RsmA [Oscillospiraceae bacterium]
MNNLTNLSFIRELLARHDFSFSKGLGQNFLVNPSVCPKIAEMGNAKKGFGIIEVGTGIGTLTAELAKRADKVVAVEIDRRLLPVLEETLSDFDNIKVINEDIMNVDLNKLIEEEFSGMDVAVCANLPYYITSPIIMYFLESGAPVKSLTVMVQKEAAERLCAEVGTRQSGAISVAVRYYGEAKMLFGVSRGSFIPAPNVDSAVIRIDVEKKYSLSPEDEKFFFKVVKAAFSQRRKTLANSLSSMLSADKKHIYEALSENNLSENSRVEQLGMESLIAFSLTLKKLISG